MARYTKKDNDNRYYIESVNGKLESNIFGHTYGESIDRFAELEEKIEHGELVEVVLCKDCQFCEDQGMSGLYCNHPDDRNPIYCLPHEFCNCGEKRHETA